MATAVQSQIENQKSKTPKIPPSTPVRRKPSLDFSLTGLIYCAMMLFMGLAAVNTQANLLFGVFGRPMPVTYEFRNDKRFWPSLSVCIAELDGVEGFTKQPQFYLLHAAAG